MNKVLMFHRILPRKMIVEPNAYVEFGTLIAQEFLEEILLSLTNLNFQFSTISNMENSIEKTIALTFDDGYSDNFEYALPILQKYNVTATFFPVVNPCKMNMVLPLDNYYQCVDGMSLTMQQRNDYIKGDIKKLFYLSDPAEQNVLLTQLFKEQPEQSRVTYMTPQQIKRLSDNGFEIGSHSLTHSLFTANYMSKSKIDFELHQSKIYLEETVNKPVSSFCFPSGYYNSDIIEQAKNIGYTSVCVIDKNKTEGTEVLPTYERIFVKPNSINEVLKKVCQE